MAQINFRLICLILLTNIRILLILDVFNSYLFANNYLLVSEI